MATASKVRQRPDGEELVRPDNPPPAVAGLTALDRERAASVADEGGVSAAQVEGPDVVAPGAAGVTPRRRKGARGADGH